ncbi:MAG TPA: plastocyanin/azurin family copper-binding protein [Anaerolineae bacterium]|nr:plastocyanin/azurin family copper-binding protein [Anaerolineae bacterium]
MMNNRFKTTDWLWTITIWSLSWLDWGWGLWAWVQGKHYRRWWPLGLLWLMTTGTAVVSAHPPTQTTTTTWPVTIRDYEFAPRNLTIQTGDTVAWHNENGFHNVIQDDALFDSGEPSNTNWTYQYTFTEPGTYQYYCQIHGNAGELGMSGVIEVLPPPPPPVQINEIRIDEPGSDTNEYAELIGPPGTSLDGVSYAILGDSGAGGSGVFELIIDLTGETIPDSGYYVIAESGFTLGTANLTRNLNFENSDNVTHMLVWGLVAELGADIDPNDDGVWEATPWWEIIDTVALLENSAIPPVGTEWGYGDISVGPDNDQVPSHVYRLAGLTSEWHIGVAEIGVTDSPGEANGGGPTAVRLKQTTATSDTVAQTTWLWMLALALTGLSWWAWLMSQWRL